MTSGRFATALGFGLIMVLAAAARADIVGRPPPAPSPPPARPNVVLILADDLGYTDLGCYGSDLYETPAIDQLARDGVRFTRAYSACTVCSPTRASLLTGKYPARLRVTDWIPGLMPANPKMLVPDWTKHLPAGEPTLADAFRAAGYVTGHVGKWHLGDGEHRAEKRGFDVSVAGINAGAPPSYFAPFRIPTLQPEGKDGEYLTDRLGEEAVRFVDANRDKPFFLYLAHFAVHTPIQGRPDLVAKYKAKLRPGQTHHHPGYAAMAESMDQTIGWLCAKLEARGLAKNTIIVFTSDNGGRVPTTSNRPLRVGKGSCYEGGTAVPLIVYWPGVTVPDAPADPARPAGPRQPVPPGVTRAGTRDLTPVITADLYPTLLEMASVPDLPNHRPDGVSLVPLLRRTGLLDRDALYWHYPHHQHYQQGGTMPYGAVRVGDFKLIEFYDDMRVELYDLGTDGGEQRDLAATMPEKVKALRDRLHAWRQEVGAQMPTPNPAYDPSKPQHDPTAAKAKAATKKAE